MASKCSSRRSIITPEVQVGTGPSHVGQGNANCEIWDEGRVLINVKPGKARDLLSAVAQLEGVRHADICWGVPDMFVEAEAADAKGLKLLTSSDSAVRGRGEYRNSYRRGVRRTELIRERIRSRAPLLLTITADVRPGHRFQPRLRDGAGAGITHPNGALRDSSQCLFDCPQQVSIALAQMGLERRLGFLSRTIRRISWPSLSSACIR